MTGLICRCVSVFTFCKAPYARVQINQEPTVPSVVEYFRETGVSVFDRNIRAESGFRGMALYPSISLGWNGALPYGPDVIVGDNQPLTSWLADRFYFPWLVNVENRIDRAVGTIPCDSRADSLNFRWTMASISHYPHKAKYRVWPCGVGVIREIKFFVTSIVRGNSKPCPIRFRCNLVGSLQFPDLFFGFFKLLGGRCLGFDQSLVGSSKLKRSNPGIDSGREEGEPSRKRQQGLQGKIALVLGALLSLGCFIFVSFRINPERWFQQALLCFVILIVAFCLIAYGAGVFL